MSGTTRLLAPLSAQSAHLPCDIVQLPGGASLQALPTTLIGQSLFFFRRYDPQTCRLLKQLCRPGGTAIDVGANIGVHTLEMASVGAIVHAFEPHPRTYARLVNNLALNPSLAVCPHECALGATASTVTLHDPPEENDGMASLNPFGDWPGLPVPQVTLDALVEARHIRDVAVIKIDVEGYEMAVLEGAAATIQRYRPAVVFEYARWTWEPAGRRFAEAEGLFRAWGYKSLQRVGRRGLRPLPLEGPDGENLVGLP